MRRTVIAYRPRASPLHAASGPVAAAYGAALATCGLLLENPVLLGALLVAVVLAAVSAGVAGELLRAARVAIVPLLMLTVIVNLLVNRGGLTVFARLGDWGVLGQVDLTTEALVYGLVFGLRLLIVSMACVLVVCTANPDELLVAMRRVSPHSALTAALTTRLVGVLAADAARLAEAQRCRPDGALAGDSGRGRRAAARLSILRATVSGALERSLDVAAVLEMRGYGTAGRRGRGTLRRRSRHDIAFALSALALVALALFAVARGEAGLHAYPLVWVATGPATLACAGLLPAVALAPFAQRRGIAR
jgi:energy-coupling factor transport system permease protein